MVACHLKRSSPVGPAEQDEGGSRPRSMSSSTTSAVASVSEEQEEKEVRVEDRREMENGTTHC